MTFRCRCCDHDGLLPVLDLGQMPLTAAFVPPERRGEPESRYPLEVVFCPQCTLLQVPHTVPPQIVFHRDYPYYSSFSDTFLEHSRQDARALIAQRGLGRENLVVELGSNDGYLLRNFVEQGIPVLGIDPAEGPARRAEELGVRTLCTFFNADVARGLRAEGLSADVIYAKNVLAHVADLHGFVEGMDVLLKDDGEVIVETPYVADLIARREFDTIYHEHLCYYSLTALQALFRPHGLSINRVRRLPLHGGSLQLRAQRRAAPDAAVLAMVEEEHRLGIDSYRYYQAFGGAVGSLRDELLSLLASLKGRGKRVAAYGAAAKGVILLNYLGVDDQTLAYVVDRNVHKHGKFLPGVGIPVRAPALLLEDLPDYLLILAWNFADEIMEQQAEYHRRNGRFIIPIPEPRVI